VLRIHRAERADGLVEALAGLLGGAAGDPFAVDVVAVQTRGMERWLTQRLSDVFGVCANVDFPSPRRLVGDAVAAASGVDPLTDPWLPERAVWPLLEVVEDSIDELLMQDLRAHLGGETRRARRFTAIRHLAQLFDRYALYRPELVRQWAEGVDGDIASDSAWQAEIWRRLRARIGMPGPAERLTTACAAIRANPGLVDLPQRISLFNLTRLPAARLEVLRALSQHRDIHLFLLHPSPGLWERIAQAPKPPTLRRADDSTASLPHNRLLATWGQDSREMQVVLDADSEHHTVDTQADSLLGHLQADVRADRRSGSATRPLLTHDDRSLRIHACHGRARQVEVLRDAILHLLQADPTLEPRDVIVMCPDIETFAPLIHATFGASHSEEGELHVRLADRSLRQTNPILGLISQLLDIADSRLTASQVLDLADRDVVRRRFRLDDDDLARLQAWVRDAGVRWGLDPAHRRPFHLDVVPTGTWQHGLDRVLAGVTMSEDGQRLVHDAVLPLDDVDSGSIELAGTFAELLDRLGEAVDRLTTPQTIDAWATTLTDTADALAESAPQEQWQKAELRRILDDVVNEATQDGVTHPAELALPEIRALLADRLQGRPTRANFRTGHLTICTLMPMRSVPHRVVCLLGMDDTIFPRKAPRDGDDLLLDDPHVGERDPRAEDRQLLLDALMSATDQLLITYTGNDERTNTPRPPAVPIGELLDVVDRTLTTSDDKPARDHVVVRHPLQPFDRRNFERDRLEPGRVWSFDRIAKAGAEALEGERPERGPFLDAELPSIAGPILELDQLIAFVRHPARAFLRQRLGIRLGDFDDEIEDALPITLDGLQKWTIGERMLNARLAGSDARAAIRAEIVRGALPPGQLGKPIVDELWQTVEGIMTGVEELLGDVVREARDVRVALSDGRLLSGTVPSVAGRTQATMTFSRINAGHRLTAWVRLLALSASDPAHDYDAVILGKAPHGNVVRAVTIGSPGADAPRLLADLVALYDRAMRAPVPLYAKTSAAYAAAVHRGDNGPRAASAEWESGFDRDRENRDAEHLRLLGGELPFADVFVPAPHDDEHGPEWDATENTRFGRYAMRLWAPLLELEQ
jgi:exodeoxyribonuclease V gamma subunit